MITKFNKFERVAGIFVVAAVTGAILLTAVTAIKKGWFATKIAFHTQVSSADSLRAGTPVTISGIRAGEVTDIELVDAEQIIVHFEILEKFHKQIHTDSLVQVIRPFIIGDKVLEVSVGGAGADVMPPGSEIKSQATMDMMDLFSGKKLGPFLGTLEGLMGNLSRLAQAFADPKRTEAFVKMFDRMDPLISNLVTMSKEVSKLSGELNLFIPQLRQESPEIGRQMSQLVGKVNLVLTTLEPALHEIGPDLPRASRRALEALDEAVITLKAIQRSFILSGKVKDVKEEESERERKPASP